MSLCASRGGEKAARCCGRCVDSCCWSWSPSCPTPAAPICPWTAALKRRASPTTPASGRSLWSRPVLCCDSTALWWASQVSGWWPKTQQFPPLLRLTPFQAPVARFATLDCRAARSDAAVDSTGCVPCAVTAFAIMLLE